MKIIFLTTFLDYGGIESKMIKISRVEDNNEWIFCAVNKGGKAEQSIRNNKKKVICFNAKYRIPSIATIRILKEFLLIEKPDVIHCAGAEAIFHGIIAAKLAGVPNRIAEEIGVPNRSIVARLVFSLTFSLCSKVLGESAMVINNIARTHWIDKKRMLVVPNFIHVEDRLRYKCDEGKKINLISICRLVPIKRIGLVLNVIARLVHSGIVNFHYFIVGDGILMEELQKQTYDLQISEYITFTGYQSSPMTYLDKSDLFILFSETEGFSNAMLEAMLCGVPILSTKVGGVEDFIVDDKNGWVVEKTEESLFKTLSRLLKMDRAYLGKIGSNGQKTVKENLSFDKYLSNLYRIYSYKE